MRLHYVEICNFRSIQQVKIHFEPRCRTLVGINESGKSNILAALSLLDPKRRFSASDVRENDSDEALDQPKYVRFLFRLEPAERKMIVIRSKARVLPPDKPILRNGAKALTISEFAATKTEGMWQVDADDEPGHASYWADGQHLVIADGWFRPKKQTAADASVQLADGSMKLVREISLIHEAMLGNKEDERFEPAELGHVSALVGRQIANVVEGNLPACVYWTYSEKNLLPGQIETEAFEADPGTCEPLKQMFALAGFPDPKLAFATYRKRPHGVRNLLERVANKATKHLKEVWAECGAIQISLTPNGSKIDASIKDAHNYFSVDRRSDGFKRFVSFLLLVSAKVRTNQLTNTLYLQDEPDLGLHPSGIKYLLKELVDMSRDNYVLVSTHSIFMIDKERIDRHILVRKKSERTSVEEVGPSNITDEEVIYNSLGYSIHEELKHNNIVFEGWRDKRLFRVFCLGSVGKLHGMNSRLASTGVCHSKGVKDVSRVVELLELYGKKGLVVSDGDDPAVEQQKRFKLERPHDVWMRYDQLSGVEEKLTAEDFIVQSVLSSAFMAKISEHPAFGTPDKAVFDSVPVCTEVKSWLQSAGANKEQISEIMNAWKSAVFEGLKAKDVKDGYIAVAKSIFKAFD